VYFTIRSPAPPEINGVPVVGVNYDSLGEDLEVRSALNDLIEPLLWHSVLCVVMETTHDWQQMVVYMCHLHALVWGSQL
jgi:hypothetical protein